MTYAAARLEAFNAMASAGMYGSTLSYGGTDYACVAENVEIERMMAQSGWQPERGSNFSMRATDWTASTMNNRSSFTYQGYTFEINGSVRIDPVEPVVFFSANLKK